MKKQNGLFVKLESAAKAALIVAALAVMTGCAADTVGSSVSTPTENPVTGLSTEAKDQTSPSGTKGGENISDPPQQSHEHSFETITNSDGTHTIRCTGEGCGEERTEACTFNEDYVCTVCGFKHEHEYSSEPVSKEDGTHIYQCTAEYCDAFTSENCSFDEEYTCTVCGFKHEHSLEAVPDYKGHHIVACTADYCDYTVNEDCTKENNLCPTCGFEFPTWKMFYYDTQEFTLNGKTDVGCQTHYVHAETVIKKHPFEDEEPIRTVQPGDEVCVIGWTKSDKPRYYLLTDGTYIRSPRMDKRSDREVLEIYPYGKVLVYKWETKNNRANITDYLLYDSMEEAMKDTMLCSFEELKKIWNYTPPGGLNGAPYWYTPNQSDQSKGYSVSAWEKNDKYPWSYTRERRVGNDGSLEYVLSYAYNYHYN